jgi:hypothetical protein
MKHISARLACLLLFAVCIAAATSVVYGMDGRWKLGDDGSCYFDPNDSGPDQCSPTPSPDVPPGRWKLGGDGSCYFDSNDSGPDQCVGTSTPATGRWKLGGDGSCVWDPNDSGPDQCTPSAAAPADSSGDSLDALLASLKASLTSSSVVPPAQ